MKEPKPISMSVHKKPPTKGVTPPRKEVSSKEPTPLVVKKIVRDKALELRVAALEGSNDKEIIVRVEAPKRARITSVKIKYDPFGTPQELVPAYSE